MTATRDGRVQPWFAWDVPRQEVQLLEDCWKWRFRRRGCTVTGVVNVQAPAVPESGASMPSFLHADHEIDVNGTLMQECTIYISPASMSIYSSTRLQDSLAIHSSSCFLRITFPPHCLRRKSSPAHPCLGHSALFAVSQPDPSPPSHCSDSRPSSPLPHLLPIPPSGLCPSRPHDLDMNTSITRASTIPPYQTCSQTSTPSRTIQPPSISRSKSVRRRPSR